MAKAVLSPAYAAGFFDGEGTVNYQCIHRTGSRLPPSKRVRAVSACDFYEWVIRFRVSNTHRGILELFQQTWGGTLHGCDAAGRRGSNRKPLFQWSVAARQAERFARDIYEFLTVKKEQVRLFLQFRETIRKPGDRGLDPETLALRLSIGKQIHACNMRGIVPVRPTPLVRER